MKVMGNNVLVKPILKDRGSIITSTEERDELTDRCIIAAVGEFVSDIPVDSTCVYNHRSGQPCRYMDEDYILIKDHDVYIVLD